MMHTYLHVSPAGTVHVSDGLSILTRCGLHPSRHKGWRVDATPMIALLRDTNRKPCRRCKPIATKAQAERMILDALR